MLKEQTKFRDLIATGAKSDELIAAEETSATLLPGRDRQKAINKRLKEESKGLMRPLETDYLRKHMANNQLINSLSCSISALRTALETDPYNLAVKENLHKFAMQLVMVQNMDLQASEVADALASSAPPSSVATSSRGTYTQLEDKSCFKRKC